MLTKRGHEVLLTLLFFFIVAMLSLDPFLLVTSYSLLLLYSLEGIIFRLSLRRLKLSLERKIYDEFLVFGQSTKVQVKIRQRGSLLMLKVEDKLPDGIRLSNFLNSKDFELSRDFNDSWIYEIEALRSGKMVFEGFNLTFYDKLNLFATHRFYPFESELKVIPKRVQEIEVKGIPKAYYRLVKRKGKVRKMLSEYVGIRDYVSGDSYRLIAWKVMARNPLVKPMTKEYEYKKIFEIFVALSSKISMNDGPLAYKKIDYAVNSALNLIHQAYRDGYRAGLAFLDKGKVRIEYGDPNKLSKFISELNLKEENKDDILLEELYKVLSFKSLVILISDLSYPDKIDFEKLLLFKAKGHAIEILLLDTLSFLSSEDSSSRILKAIEQEHKELLLEQARSYGINLRFSKKEELSFKMMEIYNLWTRVPIP
ncbi:MAG: DUF58 domain-containing protein [Nitrososphaerales archaeon]